MYLQDICAFLKRELQFSCNGDTRKGVRLINIYQVMPLFVTSFWCHHNPNSNLNLGANSL